VESPSFFDLNEKRVDDEDERGLDTTWIVDALPTRAGPVVRDTIV
jgi:hypothetical protein